MEHVIDSLPDAPVSAEQPGFHLPYAVAGPLAVVVIAVCTWCFSNSARLTTVETEIRHLATSDQEATQMQKLDDFQHEYERDRINDKVANAREAKQ
jgi:hypothetical protein